MKINMKTFRTFGILNGIGMVSQFLALFTMAWAYIAQSKMYPITQGLFLATIILSMCIVYFGMPLLRHDGLDCRASFKKMRYRMLASVCLQAAIGSGLMVHFLFKVHQAGAAFYMIPVMFLVGSIALNEQYRKQFKLVVEYQGTLQ